MSKDYYKILGVEKNTPKEDIKKAFRKLAHQYHPDKSGGDEAKFKEVNEAYSVLGDDAKRKQYDTFGSAGPGGAGFGGYGAGNGFGGFDFSGFQGFGGNGQGVEFDFGDIFGDFFGGNASRGRTRRGDDIQVDLRLTFKEAAFGVEKTISITKATRCTTCTGTGAKPGTGMHTCGTCHGKGKVQELKRTILGSVSTTRTCPTCHGAGELPKEKCPQCHGAGVEHKKQDISVKIPSGVENGEMVRLNGAGEAIQGGEPGDLYIKIHVEKHQVFIKKGNDLLMDLTIKLTEALLGSERTIETLDGAITLKIPSGVKHNEILRIKNKGATSERGKRGDILVKIHIDLPRKLSRTAEKLIEELRNEGI
jgi:molecular chaperone DnaJ